MKKISSPDASQKHLNTRVVVTALLGAWFAVLFVSSFLSSETITSPAFIYTMSWLWFSLVWMILFAILLAYALLAPTGIRWFSLTATFLYCLRAAFVGRSFFLTFALCAIMAGMLCLCGVQFTLPKKELSARGAALTLAVMGGICGAWTLTLSIGSYTAYLTSPTGSTGLYTQMLWQMTQTFGQTTTVEFGEAISHFAAHISPVFYLYLPFYVLFPSPITLMVLQAVAVCSAIIPLYLIARHHRLSRRVATLLCALLCLFPTITGATAESIHEYALLLPLLLWLIWALEKQRSVLIAVFALLCLCVRETAALYVLTVGLYWLLSHGIKTTQHPSEQKKHRFTALVLMAVAAVYLIVAWTVLTYAGQGTLITRYENITGVYNTSFWTLLWEHIMNPAVILYESLTVNKLHFLVCLLLPLGFLPLLSKRKATLVFLLPVVLINLLPDVSYPHHLLYPYGFAPAALALYSAILALSRLKDTRPDGQAAARIMTLAVCFTLIIGSFGVGQYHVDDLAYAAESQDTVATITELLTTVPSEASVKVSGRLLPHIAHRAHVYTLDAEATTDYVVLDLRKDLIASNEEAYTVETYTKAGYIVVASEDGIAAVLRFNE